jgi:hypothetical protein
MSETKRVCIYPKDIMRITGKSERYSRRLLNRIKRHYNKSSHQFITVSELALFTGIDQLTIEQNLVD